MSKSSQVEAPITPLHIPRSARGIILFGGAFDPPHKWHTRVAVAARRQLFPRDGWIVFVPTGRSPLKAGPVASAADRVAMLRLATKRLKRVRIWTDEIDRGEFAASGGRGGSKGRGRTDSAGARPSYTIDTVRRLRQIVAVDLPIRLLIGADQAVQFHKWRDFRELLTLAEPVVVPRPPIDSAKKFLAALRQSGAWVSSAADDWRARLISTAASRVSSSEVRRVLSAGGKGETSMSPAVANFTRRTRLYRPELSLYQLPVR